MTQPPGGNHAKAMIANPSSMVAATTPPIAVYWRGPKSCKATAGGCCVFFPLGAAANGEPIRSGVSSTTRAMTGTSSLTFWSAGISSLTSVPTGLGSCVGFVRGGFGLPSSEFGCGELSIRKVVARDYERSTGNGEVSEAEQVRISQFGCQIYHCHQGRLQFILGTPRPLILVDFRPNRSVMTAHKSSFHGDQWLSSCLGMALTGLQGWSWLFWSKANLWGSRTKWTDGIVQITTRNLEYDSNNR